MPNWTVNDYWTRYLGSEGNASEPTPARNADAGTYLQSLGLDAPVTYVPWKADKLTMKTIDGTQKEIELVKAPTTEELLKHTHNPRGLKKPTTPALEFFAKNLPPVGSKIYFQLIEGQSSPAKVEENDERTVYITTPYGLQGYLCPCSFCSSSWQAVVTTSRQRDWDGWYGDHELARQEMRWAENRYQKQYLGHIGAIKRAINLGLLTKDGKRAVKFGILHSWEGNGGALIQLRNKELLYNVPEFVENSAAQPAGAINPPEASTSADFWSALRPMEPF